MPAPNTTNDLGQEVEGFFFGGIIWERKAGVGLDNTDGGKEGEI